MYPSSQNPVFPVNPAVVSSLVGINPGQGVAMLMPSESEIRRAADRLFAHLNGAKAVVYVDGANFHSTTRQMGFVADYKKMRDLFVRNSKQLDIHYFVAINYDQTHKQPTVMMDSIAWMAKNGYIIHQKSTKMLMDDAGGRTLKGNMDVEMTVEAMQTPDDVSHVILMTGDGDFCRLVRALQARGKYVTVISTESTQRRRIAEDLRRAADRYIDMEDFRHEISRLIASPEARRKHALRHIRRAS